MQLFVLLPSQKKIISDVIKNNMLMYLGLNHGCLHTQTWLQLLMMALNHNFVLYQISNYIGHFLLKLLPIIIIFHHNVGGRMTTKPLRSAVVSNEGCRERYYLKKLNNKDFLVAIPIRFG